MEDVCAKLDVKKLPSGLLTWVENYGGVDTSDEKAIEEFIMEHRELVVRVCELLVCGVNGRDSSK